MKNLFWIISAMVLIIMASCEQKPNAITDAQKDTITKEVQKQSDLFIKSLNTMDSKLLRQIFSDSNFLEAIFNGVSIKSLNAVMDSVNYWFSYRSEQGIDKSDVQIDVLSNDLAMVTNVFEGHITLKNSGQRFEIKIHAVSLLFRREPSGWKIIYYHESGQ